MTDIVERLRANHDWNGIGATCMEAAAEIERLRTENAAMRRQTLQNIIHISENAGIYERQRELQRGIYNILASDPTPMATLKDTLKE